MTIPQDTSHQTEWSNQELGKFDDIGLHRPE